MPNLWPHTPVFQDCLLTVCMSLFFSLQVTDLTKPPKPPPDTEVV